MGTRLPRGIRNNNPLNIRKSKSKWQGLVENSPDKEFCVFEHMKWGWRAAFKLLCDTYYKQWGLRTIRDIIHRWAPPNVGNHADVYIAQVAMSIGWPDSVPMPDPKENPSLWRRMAWAMARIENGTLKGLGYEDMIVGFSLYVNPSSKVSYKKI